MKDVIKMNLRKMNGRKMSVRKINVMKIVERLFVSLSLVPLFLYFEIVLKISALLLKDNTYSVSVSLGYSRVGQPAITFACRPERCKNQII